MARNYDKSEDMAMAVYMPGFYDQNEVFKLIDFYIVSLID